MRFRAALLTVLFCLPPCSAFAADRADAIAMRCTSIRGQKALANGKAYVARNGGRTDLSDEHVITLLFRHDGPGLLALGQQVIHDPKASRDDVEKAYAFLLFAQINGGAGADQALEDLTSGKRVTDDETHKAREYIFGIQAAVKKIEAKGIPENCRKVERDSQRLADAFTIAYTLRQYARDHHGDVPSVIRGAPAREICGVPSARCGSLWDLSILLQDYLVALQRDPLQAKGAVGTGYVVRLTEDGHIVVSAPKAELRPVSVSVPLQEGQ
jgi:hypothetical protein